MLSLDYGVELGGQARAVATVNFVCFWLRSSCRQILRSGILPSTPRAVKKSEHCAIND